MFEGGKWEYYLFSVKLDNTYPIRCEEGMELLENDSVDLVLTSPPYDEIRQYNGFELDMDKVISELYRVIKLGGVIVWIIGMETNDKDESISAFKQVIKFKEVGFNLYDTMIYKKRNPLPKTHRRYEDSFEFMFIFSKGNPKTINLITEDCKGYGKLQKGNTHIQDKSDKYTLRHKEGQILNYKIRSNIWEYSVGNSERYRNIITRKHPAKFPLLLARDHILSWSNSDEIVLDPFMGSGTTAIAARLSNREFIGFEISEEYCNKIQQYIELLNKKIQNKDKIILRYINEINEMSFKVISYPQIY